VNAGRHGQSGEGLETRELRNEKTSSLIHILEPAKMLTMYKVQGQDKWQKLILGGRQGIPGAKPKTLEMPNWSLIPRRGALRYVRLLGPSPSFKPLELITTSSQPRQNSCGTKNSFKFSSTLINYLRDNTGY
jgi:hypothetical protein